MIFDSKFNLVQKYICLRMQFDLESKWIFDLTQKSIRWIGSKIVFDSKNQFDSKVLDDTKVM